MHKRVNVDICNSLKISGWAVNDSDSSQRISLDLFIDGKFHYMIFAHNLRADLVAAEIGDGRCGFEYKFSQLIRSKKQAVVSLRLSETGEIVYSRETVFNKI